MDMVKVVAWEDMVEGKLGCDVGQPVSVVGHLHQRRWGPPAEAPPETHVVMISQVYTDRIVERTPSDYIDVTPRSSKDTAAA